MTHRSTSTARREFLKFLAASLHVAALGGVAAFVRYELELKTGAKFRHTEYFRFEGNRVKQAEVYFGSLPDGNREESPA